MRLGIVGGSGALGRAIALAHLTRGRLAPGDLWIANRDGRRDGFEDFPGVTVTGSAQDLAGACDAILLAVPPALFPALELCAPDRLILSVMAGVSIAAMRAKTGSERIARGMSSPVAELGLAHSSFVCAPGAGAADRDMARAVFAPCGVVDEVAEEGLMDLFCALTGPVPGFLALYAASMVEHAVARGMPAEVADRAVRQLFLAGGQVLGGGAESAVAQVTAMIDYAGTTAAGLRAMQAAGLAGAIGEGLDAAAAKAHEMGGDRGGS